MNRELYYLRMNYRFEKIIVFYFINFRQYLTYNSRGTQHTLYIRFSSGGGGGGRGGWMVRETIFQKQTYRDEEQTNFPVHYLHCFF